MVLLACKAPCSCESGGLWTGVPRSPSFQGVPRRAGWMCANGRPGPLRGRSLYSLRAPYSLSLRRSYETRALHVRVRGAHRGHGDAKVPVLESRALFRFQGGTPGRLSSREWTVRSSFDLDLFLRVSSTACRCLIGRSLRDHALIDARAIARGGSGGVRSGSRALSSSRGVPAPSPCLSEKPLFASFHTPQPSHARVSVPHIT
jgi:hypothetical protein